jgi:crossover junction endodeoxyribonuclease RusA
MNTRSPQVTRQTFFLPWPPSANGMWRALKGRNILSERYRLWRETASKTLIAQRPKPVLGPVRVAIALSPPDARAYDLDNRVKPILDLLVSNRVIGGGGHITVRELTVSAAESPGGGRLSGARVTVEPFASAQTQAA